MCILKRIHNIISPNIVSISLKGIRLRTKLHELHLDNNKICFLSVDADSTEKTKKKKKKKIHHHSIADF